MTIYEKKRLFMHYFARSLSFANAFVVPEGYRVKKFSLSKETKQIKEKSFLFLEEKVGVKPFCFC